jgi:hypothetical protein
MSQADIPERIESALVSFLVVCQSGWGRLGDLAWFLLG